MALPPTYDQTLDTLVSTALDTYSTDPINVLTDSGEKFLKAAASQGRVFVVNDAENIRSPLLYDHGEDSSLYSPDRLSGVPEENNLSATAKEILTHCRFTLQAATRNINFPQSQPPGNLIDYVSTVVKANMMHILNEEEQLFVRGNAGAVGTGTGSTKRGAAIADADYSSGFPTSLPAVMLASTARSDDGDTTSEAYAGITTDDISRWTPYQTATTGTSGKHDKIFTDLQSAILNASYSEIERPTHVYCNLDSFEAILEKLRNDAALPDPVRTDMGKEGTIAFGGVTIDWSRYLSKEAMWDADGENTTATYPMLGINWNSLRLNTVRAGAIGNESIGFIRQISSIMPHPTLSNVFKRIEWKRQWSVDNGRRSFFVIDGLTDSAIA
ncbi:MAG: hypothetical protein CL581_03510 [Alteromonadaceae bacterium]|nr:hypothetical protein [Alteromonadaceae bacterium]